MIVEKYFNEYHSNDYLQTFDVTISIIAILTVFIIDKGSQSFAISGPFSATYIHTMKIDTHLLNNLKPFQF